MAVTATRKKREQVADLWRRYTRRRTLALREQLVLHYAPLVRYHAERLKANMPGSVDVNDLMNAGMVGLIEAIGKFDPGRNVRFEIFCAARVQGSMLDELRRNDWVPRQVRVRAQRLAIRRDMLAADLDRPPADDEMAEHMGMALDEYRDLAEHLTIREQISMEGAQASVGNCAHPLSLADLKVARAKANPLKHLLRRELREAAMRGLNQKEKTVLVMYYYDELTMKEIGEVLGISESRVCQIHSQVLKLLRRRFTELGLDEPVEDQ